MSVTELGASLEGERVACGETAFACRRGNPSSGELASEGGFPAVGDCELAVGGFPRPRKLALRDEGKKEKKLAPSMVSRRSYAVGSAP